MKVALFAMTSKGYEVLRVFLKSSDQLVTFVVGARDSFIDNDYYDAIEKTCSEFGIAFYNRNNHPKISCKNVIVAISWRWIINAKDIPIIVFHDSILPRCRGFNPLVTALLNGDNQIGVTSLYATSEYDKGDIVGQSISKISYPITIAEAIEIIHLNYSELARELACSIEKGVLPAGNPQSDKNATYSLWRDDSDYQIDWSHSSDEIRRHVDAVGSPYLGAITFMDSEPVRILKVREYPDVVIENRKSGKVIFIFDNCPIVVCGKGLLMIEEMVSFDKRKSLLPLKKFRTRFSNSLS